MKTYTVVLSLALAVAGATAANAAKRVHHHTAAVAATASKTDWPGNPYMDSKPSQVSAFWRDAFNPWGATAK